MHFGRRGSGDHFDFVDEIREGSPRGVSDLFAGGLTAHEGHSHSE